MDEADRLALSALREAGEKELTEAELKRLNLKVKMLKKAADR